MVAAAAGAHPNEERFRAAYARLAKGDLVGGAHEILAPDVVCHVAGRSPLAGDLQGRDAVLALLRRLSDVSGGSYTIAASDVLANDRHVVVLEEHACVVDGGRYDGLGVTVARVEDGVAREIWVHAGDPYGADAFRTMVAARAG